MVVLSTVFVLVFCAAGGCDGKRNLQESQRNSGEI